jgi:hypothetical protein
MPNNSGSKSSGLIHRWVPPTINDMSVSFETSDVHEAPGANDMSGSSEISDTCDTPAGARVATPVMVERPKSARQALRFLLIRMFGFADE